MPAKVERTHKFHAEAKVLEGELKLPLVQKIQPQAHAQLHVDGGYKAQHSIEYRLESVLTYSRAHSQVAGNAGVKTGQGWNTITTTVIENLNVLEVLTADRVVGQIITEHPLVGYVPTISFLGTRFENLRIAGHPVKLDWDLDILGETPAGEAPYTKDAGVVSRVTAQYDRIRKNKKLPTPIVEQYNRLSSKLGKPEAVECSLVNQASGDYPGFSHGHIIKVPQFGWITLGKIKVTHDDFDPKSGVPKLTTVHLTMIELDLGSPINGGIIIGNPMSNGNTKP